MSEVPQERLKAGIENYLGEWLDCYVLVGFDSVGNLVTIYSAVSDRDMLALNAAYRDWADEAFGGEGEEYVCDEDWED